MSYGENHREQASVVGVERFWHGISRGASGLYWLPVSGFEGGTHLARSSIGCQGVQSRYGNQPSTAPGLNWRPTRTVSATPQTQPAKPTAVLAVSERGAARSPGVALETSATATR